MKIVTLDRDQMRLWFRNRPVLVDSETGEAVMFEGQPINPTKQDVLGLLKASKKKQSYTVERDGKACHYVNGRDFLKRTFVRAYQQPVQLRIRTGTVVGCARPKFAGHDVANSEVKPIDNRAYKQAKLDIPVAMVETHEGPRPMPIPAPDKCPKCAQYSKPIGCREDEHHFVCTYHDRWEEIRKARLQAEVEAAGRVPMAPSDTFIIDLENGAPLREATPDEIAEATSLVEKDELPIITIDDIQYAVGTPNFVLPGT